MSATVNILRGMSGEWCTAQWYVIYPVALLPRLERGSFKYSEAQRSNSCMQHGMPLQERLGRQILRPGPRECCYYHSVDWRQVAAEAVRIACEVPLAAQMPPGWAKDDSDEAEEAYERAWQPHERMRELARACGLPERERKAVQELLSPATAIWLVHSGGGGLGYQNGRHRAHALMSAGVRWVPVIRDHCCEETGDCSPAWLRVHHQLPASHISECDLVANTSQLWAALAYPGLSVSTATVLGMGQKSRRRSATERVGPGRLTHGWNGPQGTLLRLARPGEAKDIARLAETTGGPLDEWMHAAIEDGTASAALFAALRSSNKALIDPASRCAATGDPTPFTELSLALVAERDEIIVGALYALPPGGFIAEIINQGIEILHAMVVAISVIKIKAVAVDPASRGQGIASALLTGCVRLYDQLGYHLQYGSFAVDSGLETFYSGRGFEVLPVGGSIPLDIIVGQPIRLGTHRTERLFARWRF
jgi:GNAT superfamily N-acetyltransferase